MKNVLIVSALLILCVQGCKEEDIFLTDTGRTVENPLDLDEFENVSLSGPVSLRFTQGETPYVSVETTPYILDQMKWEVRDRTLEIGFDQNVRRIDPNVEVWINVTLPYIRKISSSGISKVISVGEVDLPSLSFQVTGTTEITFVGHVDEQIISVSGEADIYNFGLVAQNTSISISGIGDVRVSCTESLDLDVSGTAKIAYKGSPAISQKTSGILSVSDAN